VSGHTSFKTLRERINANAERKAESEQAARAYAVLIALAQLHDAHELERADILRGFEASQREQQRPDRLEDLKLTTLADLLAALGGRLELSAVFPDRTVHLGVPDASAIPQAKKGSQRAASNSLRS
jgi:hypothetical protein